MSLKDKQRNLVRDKQSLGDDGYIILGHYLNTDVKQVVQEYRNKLDIAIERDILNNLDTIRLRNEFDEIFGRFDDNGVK